MNKEVYASKKCPKCHKFKKKNLYMIEDEKCSISVQRSVVPDTSRTS